MSKIQVNEIVNHFDTGAPDCPKGLTVTGFTTFSGGVSIGGTLTYEDVTNIDSVGIITAQSGIHALGSGNLVGIGTTNPQSRLHVSGTTDSHIRMTNTTSDAVDLIADANRSGSDQTIFSVKGRWNGTDVSRIVFRSGSDTTDKDDGYILFQTRDSGSSIAERLRITSAGIIQCGTSSTLKAEINNAVSGHQFISQCSDNNNGFEVYQQHGSNTTRNNLVVYGNTGAGNAKHPQFVVRGDGRVAIGTDSPASLIHGLVSSGSAGLTLESTADSGEASVALKGKNSSGTVRTATIKYDNGDRYRIAVVSNIALDFETNDTGRMRLNAHGGLNVGGGVLSAASAAGNIVVDEGIYISTFNGDNQIRGNSAGSGSATLYIGNAAINTSSDRRLKENIVDTVVDAAEELKRVRVVDFTWNDSSDLSYNNKNARGTWTGVIAQELVDVFPFAVNAPRKEEDLSIDHDSEKTWMLNQDQLVPVLIKGFQQALTRIESLEAEVSELRGN